MIIAFFDSCGIVQKEFLPPGQTVKSYLLLRCPGRTSKMGLASLKGYCRRLGAAPR